MAGCKQVLVALTPWDFVTAAGMVKGVNRYLLTHPRVRAHFCMLDPDTDAALRLVRRLVAQCHPNGLLAHVSWERAALRLGPDVPVVNLNDERQPAYPSVLPDQWLAGRMVAEHLLKQDVEHYAFVAASNRDHYTRQRWQGFQGRLREAGLTCCRFGDKNARPRGATVTDAELSEWVAELPKPVGIHAGHTGLAVRLEWVCAERGLDVPEDVALVGGQEITDLAMTANQPVTTIDQERPRVGYEAMQLLDRLMHGGRAPKAPVLIPPAGIIQRRSSDMRSMRDPEMAALRRLIRERADQRLVVKELVGMSSLTRRVLERRFRKHVGHSPHEDIVLARIERAQRLLRETLMPVTRVAAQCGYANYSVFSVAFRKHAGMSALEYRRRGLTVT